MSNDDLLRALGRLSARQAEDDDRPLPPELTAPPSAATRARLADQALAALAPVTPAPVEVTARRPAVARRPAIESRPGWFQRLYARRTLLLAAPALGAAAVGLLFARGRGGAPLPAYTMQLSGGVATVRGTEPPAARALQLDQGSRVELRLRPERPIAPGGVEVQLYWARAGQQVRWSAASTEISEQGAVRVVGTAPRPFGAGAGELVVAVGRPGAAGQTLRAPVRWR